MRPQDVGYAQRYRQELINGLEHPRHKDIIWNGTTKRYHTNVDGKARELPGVHSLLDVLCPTPDNKDLAKYRPKAAKVPDLWNEYTSYAERQDLFGKERGTLVHEQLDVFCKEGMPGLKRKFPEPHVFTMNLIHWMRKHSLIPLVSEYLVFDELHLGFATRVDIIVWNNTTKTYELWDLKTGYTNVFCIGTGYAVRPLHKYFDNSNLSRALVQVLLAKLAFKYRYGMNFVARVILINEYGVKSQVLPSSVMNNLERIYRECSTYLKRVRLSDRLKQEKDLKKRSEIRKDRKQPAIKSTWKPPAALHARPRPTAQKNTIRRIHN